MTKEKIEYIKNNIGFHLNDLSIKRQMELKQYINDKGISQDWIFIALSQNSLEDWEKFGFALFNKPDFSNRVTNLLNAYENESNNTFKNANQWYKLNDLLSICRKGGLSNKQIEEIIDRDDSRQIVLLFYPNMANADEVFPYYPNANSSSSGQNKLDFITNF